MPCMLCAFNQYREYIISLITNEVVGVSGIISRGVESFLYTESTALFTRTISICNPINNFP